MSGKAVRQDVRYSEAEQMCLDRGQQGPAPEVAQPHGNAAAAAALASAAKTPECPPDWTNTGTMCEPPKAVVQCSEGARLNAAGTDCLPGKLPNPMDSKEGAPPAWAKPNRDDETYDKAKRKLPISKRCELEPDICREGLDHARSGPAGAAPAAKSHVKKLVTGKEDPAESILNNQRGARAGASLLPGRSATPSLKPGWRQVAPGRGQKRSTRGQK